MQATNFIPPSVIPAFNAWGNHPENMRIWIRENMYPAFNRLSLDGYETAEQILFSALDDIAARLVEFAGYYEPTPAMERVLYEFLMGNFIKPDKCNFYGIANYRAAMELIEQGKNVLIVQNHTSPLDALVPFTLIRRNFPGAQLPAIIMSQVFEYSRIAGIVTSGVRKFPVYQPKHMRKFAETENGANTVIEMKRKNSVALKQLLLKARTGGQTVFLYPERDRNSFVMGVPEPKAMKIVRLLASAGPELYIMPTFITGLQTIFPNCPGTNELDDFFKLIQVGQGDFYCGKPICITDVLEKAIALGNSAFEKVFEQLPDDISDAGLSITILKMIASLAPDKEMTGVYADLIA